MLQAHELPHATLYCSEVRAFLTPTVCTLRPDILSPGRTQVDKVPPVFLRKHFNYTKDVLDASKWPKHLLVRYTFKTENDISLDRGLYVVFGLGSAVLLILGLNACYGNGAKLSQFLRDMTADDSPPGDGANGSLAASAVAPGAMPMMSRVPGGGAPGGAGLSVMPPPPSWMKGGSKGD